MLGADDESGLTTGNLVDALKEILNMVLGNVLTEVYGNEPVFDLDLPQLLPAKTISTSTANSFRLWFSAEGEPIMFLVEIEPPKTK